MTDPQAGYRVAVDIGGTFTDVVVDSPDRGLVGSSKVLTTPGDPADGFLSGVQQALTNCSLPLDVARQVIHATTLVTNAIIERRGARVGLLTTAGFRDILEMRSETRYDLYDLHLTMPQPLVPRQRRAEVVERIGADGTILETLDLDAALATVEELVEKQGVEALAICLLHSYVNPAHEQALAKAIEERYPRLPLSLSSEVAPFVREYPRSSTTAANAFVQPLTENYLGQIRRRLDEAGLDRPRVYLMLSHGGLTDLDSGAEVPIRLCESGPAAGVIAASSIAREGGLERVISFDMGGTTAKICMVLDGIPVIGRELEVAHESRFMAGSGLPLTIQSVQLLEIGAGGGSIAGLDATGLLEVGPESAGAEPGPACYGRGGSDPTVTDANLVLGHLPRNLLLGGRLPLVPEASSKAFEGLARHFGTTPVEVARAVFDLVNEKMALAMRRHLVEHGHEPAGFTLVTTGGAGPLHACSLAQKLDIERVIVPRSAGVGSAVGLLLASYVVERSRSQPVALGEVSGSDLRSIFGELELEARGSVDSSFADEYLARYFADVRYQGQGYELPIEIEADAIVSDDLPAIVAREFERAYRDRFGRQLAEWPVEVLAFTVRLESAARSTQSSDSSYLPSPPETGEMWLDGNWHSVEVRPWPSLQQGTPVEGPLVITDANTTVLVPAGWIAQRQPAQLELRKEAAR